MSRAAAGATGEPRKASEPAAAEVAGVQAQDPAAIAASGWMLTVAAVTMFSFATPMTKHAIVTGVDPLSLLAARMVFGSLLIAGWMVALSPGRLRLSPRHAALAFAAGASNGIGMVGYFYALLRIDGSIATMIFACSPLCTLAILAMRGERITRRSMVRIAIGTVGVWLIVGPSGRVDLWGVAGVVLSAITFSWHLAILQWKLADADGRATTLMIVIGMAAISLLAWAVLGGAQWHPLGVTGWTTAISLAVVSTWLARLALFEGVRRIGSGQVSMLLPIETPLAVTWSVIFRGERLHLIEALGGFLIVSSALLGTRRTS